MHQRMSASRSETLEKKQTKFTEFFQNKHWLSIGLRIDSWFMPLEASFTLVKNFNLVDFMLLTDEFTKPPIDCTLRNRAGTENFILSFFAQETPFERKNLKTSYLRLSSS